MSIKIKWIPINGIKVNIFNNEVNITHFPPEPAFKYFASLREESEFLKCPAFAKTLKNTFVLKSPYDMTITVNAKNKTCHVLNQSQMFYDSHIFLREIPNDSDPLMLSIPPRYIFLTDSKVPVEITCLPMFLTPNYQFGVIPGSFDITKWVRFVECAFEVFNPSDTIKIKIGDPLYMVTFTPANDDTVILEKDICTKEIRELQAACVRVKHSVSGLNLNTLYDMSHEYIQIMFKKIFSKKK